jgi:hypothetical protein
LVLINRGICISEENTCACPAPGILVERGPMHMQALTIEHEGRARSRGYRIDTIRGLDVANVVPAAEVVRPPSNAGDNHNVKPGRALKEDARHRLRCPSLRRLCGKGAYHLMEKTDGQWREAKINGVEYCMWIS